MLKIFSILLGIIVFPASGLNIKSMIIIDSYFAHGLKDIYTLWALGKQQNLDEAAGWKVGCFFYSGIDIFFENPDKLLENLLF